MTRKKALPESARRKPLHATPLDDAPPSNDRLDDILGALGAPGDGFEFQIKVYFVESNNAESLLFVATEEQAPTLAEYLRDNCGTGTYRVYVRKIGAGVRELVGKTTIRVRTIASLQQLKGPAPVAALPDRRDDALTRVLENQSRLLETIAAKLATPPPDALAQVQAFAKIIESLKPVLAPPAPVVQQGDPFEMFERGLDYARDYGGGGDTVHEEGVLGTIKALLPLARDYMEAQRGNGTSAAASSATPLGVEHARPQVSGASLDARAPSPPPPPRDPGVEALVHKIKDQVQHFAI